MRLPAIVAVVASASVLLAGGASAFGIDLENPPTPGVVGMPYKYVFIPKKGAPPYAFWLDAGELPPGLKIEADGTMQGTPQAPGYWEFTVGASQYNGNETQWGTSVTIRDRLNITTASLRGGVVGAPYAAPVSVVGNEGRGMAWTVSAGALPPGLALAANGTPADTTISGTPTTPGTYTFTLRVDDTDGFMPSRAVTRQYTLTVGAQLSATAAASIPSGIEGKAVQRDSRDRVRRPRAVHVVGRGHRRFPVRSDARPRYGGDPRPADVVRDVRVRASRQRCQRPDRARAGGADRSSGHSTCARRSCARQPSATRTPRPCARSAGRLRFGSQLAGGKLPAGLKLNAKTGVVTGKPKTAGTFRFRVTATDALGQRSSERIALLVKA